MNNSLLIFKNLSISLKIHKRINDTMHRFDILTLKEGYKIIFNDEKSVRNVKVDKMRIEQVFIIF